eukprot:7790571-Pyramimonas_sp.AAC.1
MMPHTVQAIAMPTDGNDIAFPTASYASFTEPKYCADSWANPWAMNRPGSDRKRQNVGSMSSKLFT